MAVIGITINEVLRDFIGQFIYTYTKYVDPNCDIKSKDIIDYDLSKYFDFNSKEELNKFLYEEAALEIFGHADQIKENIFTHFNNFLIDIDDEEKHTVVLISREISKSIPSTLFFLSKVGCKINNIKFVKEFSKMWEDVDLLITANPEVLKSKPSDKISLKINSSYNKNIDSDYELDSILEFFNNKDFINKIFNTKTTTYEEI